MRRIQREPHVDSIIMPENLRVGLIVAEQRKKCQRVGCVTLNTTGSHSANRHFTYPNRLHVHSQRNTDKGHYSDAKGIYELRKAVAGFNKRHFKVDVDPSEIIIGPGTKQLIHMVFDIVRGDVILPSPSWIGYFPQIKLLDKHFHTFYMKPEDKYKIQPENLDAFLAGVHKEQAHTGAQ